MTYEEKVKQMHLNNNGYSVLINVDSKQRLVPITDVIIDTDYTLGDLLSDVQSLKKDNTKYKATVDKLVKSNNAICDVGKFMKGKIK